MPYTIGTLGTRTSSAGNPITTSVTVATGETVLCVSLHVVGATNRAGGSLTWGTDTLTQANSTQKAAASPEGSAELWYLLNPSAGTQTLTIPNSGALTIRYQTIAAKCASGGRSTFLAGWGTNGTSTNPSAGTQAIAEGEAFLIATVFSGATTWAPSARTGTQIHDTDDGAFGGGAQYLIQNTPVPAGQAMSWTFGTSDDWGAVAAAFGTIPPLSFNNYLAVAVGDGMGTTDRV